MDCSDRIPGQTLSVQRKINLQADGIAGYRQEGEDDGRAEEAAPGYRCVRVSGQQNCGIL